MPPPGGVMNKINPQFGNVSQPIQPPIQNGVPNQQQ